MCASWFRRRGALGAGEPGAAPGRGPV